MEAQLRAETTRIEPNLARRKLKLEQMEVKKQLDMAKARLKAYQVAEEIENEKDPVEDDLSRASLIQTTPASLPPLQEPRHLRSDVTASRETQPTQQLQDVHNSPSVLQESSSADKSAEIVTTIASQHPNQPPSAVNPSIIRIGSRPYLYSGYKSNNCTKLIFKPSSCHELINDSKPAATYRGPDSSLNKVQS